MNELLNSIANFSPEQLEYLKLQLEKLNKGTPTPAQTRITPRKRESNVFPLTLAQQGYWFHEQLNPTKTNANITAAMRVAGPLDVAALERALQECVRRHEILRTAFKVVGEGPAQVISPASALRLKLVDLSGLPAHEREDRALSLASEEPSHRFALEQGTLLRAAVIRLHAEEHILLLTIHHIICDRWAHAIFVRELLTLYTAFTAGAPSPLPEPPIQYADFALWQHEWLQSEEMKKQLSYWKRQLEGAPPSLNLPTAQTRSPHRRAESMKYHLLFPKELTAGLKAFAQREETTLFVTLLAAFKVLLYRLTGQEDIVVGSVIANRNRPELEHAIGLFANPVPLRSKFSAEMSFRQALRRVFDTTLDAHANQDLPFERLVQELQPEREGGRAPLFQVVFNLQQAPSAEAALPGLTLSPLNVSKELAGFDLFWLLKESEQGLSGVLEYNAGLFEGGTVEQIVEAYLGVLQAAVGQAELSLSQFTLPATLETMARGARLRAQGQALRLTATFTAEPVEEVLAFWMEELDTPARIEFAPYNQIFQQLLDPSGLLSTNKRGVNIVLLRLDDWLRDGADVESRAGGDSWTTTAEETVERNLQDFIAALRSAVERSAVPYILCLCPVAPAMLTDARSAAFFARSERRLVSELAGLGGLHLITAAETTDLYPVREYFDEVRDRLGHVPYTPEFFAALGTHIARKIHAIQSRPSKVIVVDADETLWKGVCAEDGVAGIELDAPRRALQEFLSAQHESGMLLCLCSKNDERDVAEVFERRADMRLKREQIVSWRINWSPKSENLRSLAQELDLGLDSFIFLDDNPLECAEVAAHCPQVLTLQLPPDAESVPRFVKHVWALDVLKTTEEDKRRTASYRQNRERELLHRESVSFEDFIRGLDLQVEIAETTPREAARAAQLTQRTTQFNTASVVRSETEMQGILRSAERVCLSVTVRDRFGEYGLVGILVGAARGQALEVEMLLLSCRVLGRGVEHRMIAELGRRARAKGLTRVSIPCVRTGRNQPVRDFLDGIAADFKRPFDGGLLYQIPAEVAESLTFQPGQARQPGPAAEVGDAARAAPPGVEESPSPSRLKSAVVQRIATELADVGQILRSLEARTPDARAKEETAYAAPRTPIEEMLANLWASTLKLDRVGINDNFFKSGGHSLLGTLLISRIRDTFQVELPLLSLFDAPTVAGLAEIIEQQLLGQVEASELSEMMQGVEQLTDEEVKALLLDEAAQLEHDGAAE